MAASVLNGQRPTPDMLAELGKRSAALRAERAAMRRTLGSGELRLSAVVRELPACAYDQLIFDLLRQRLFGHGKLRALNRSAIAAGVNLGQPLWDASEHTRAWLRARLEEAGR